MTMHPDEIEIRDEAVSGLIAAQFPHWAQLPIRRVRPGGTVSAILLAAGERLTGVLDCGGFAAADPALDVIAAWHLLDSGARPAFRAALGCDDTEWERGKAWAFVQAVGLVWYYAASNPPLSQAGRRTLARITAAPQP